MNEQDVTALVNSLLQQAQYNVANIPDHVHNGTDSQQIDASSLNNLSKVAVTSLSAGSGITLTGSVGAVTISAPSTGKFGGTGADGALVISSGTTNINLAGAAVVIKNYTSIAITGTGALTFTNPATNGTIVVLKSQGNVTLTSSATRAIDLRGIGGQGGAIAGGQDTSGFNAAGGAGGAGPTTSGVTPTNATGASNGPTTPSGNYGIGFLICPGGKGQASGSALAGIGGVTPNISSTPAPVLKFIPIACGGGSAYGTLTNSGSPGTSAPGGGALYIECGGAYNNTLAVIDASGTIGGNGTGRCGGGGGGGGGSIGALYNTLTNDTGTYTVAGGVAGTASSGQSGGDGGVGLSFRAQNTEFL